jgi:hypothetical protein
MHDQLGHVINALVEKGLIEKTTPKDPVTTNLASTTQSI